MESDKESRKGKFSSGRDEALYLMSIDGWGNESSGNVECSTGYFARMSNEQDELREIEEAFKTELTAIGLPNADSLLGNFLVVEDSQGFVTVSEFDTQAELMQVYDELANAYDAWAGGSA